MTATTTHYAQIYVEKHFFSTEQEAREWIMGRYQSYKCSQGNFIVPGYAPDVKWSISDVQPYADGTLADLTSSSRPGSESGQKVTDFTQTKNSGSSDVDKEIAKLKLVFGL